MKNAWLLPEYVEDVLPPYALALETLRRRLLDLFASHGYELVQPPLIEYLDSLLTGAAQDLDLKTFKVLDSLSGRLLGVRADITPQAARIDAHLLNRQGVTRLCYAGTVLHTRPSAMLNSREPFQVGAELFGHAGIEADRESLQLLTAALKAAGLDSARVSLGHVGLFRALAQAAGVAGDLEAELFAALQHKDAPQIAALTANLESKLAAAFRRLPELYGGVDMLAAARRDLPALPGVAAALDDLAALLSTADGIALSVDLADLRGYGYHNGVVFAAYVGGQAGAIGQGGRYDGAGAIFGRSRPATGFSLDLRQVIDSLPEPVLRPGILAPYGQDPGLQSAVAKLRAVGERVVIELPGQAAHRAEAGCDRQLALQGGTWQVIPL
ncbi:ATP phosphoribosyltransferase regulatory subunit [Sulfuritortus calidifontis]|uniref:ATP phosphoribosyltransferase regulatory subunit n=1 Tax=Sulfuritortus calidifontis TaxID=1914471 RepID=A0A4R3JSA7_9PROT|nr:ATP phosphoribosyltransferase regulatory subunit [Sulfuritortus calidifontis]TCS70118.1 ATP phosphoribosyltransferase regulatory subunit [Sulfuritortus calidifontis]